VNIYLKSWSHIIIIIIIISIIIIIAVVVVVIIIINVIIIHFPYITSIYLLLKRVRMSLTKLISFTVLPKTNYTAIIIITIISIIIVIIIIIARNVASSWHSSFANVSSG
jgi:hypothetical protein